MHESTQTRERRIVLEPKALNQDLEGHLGIHVRERRAVEVKPDCPFRAVFRPLYPHEPGLWVNEAPDQPCRTDAIDPQVLARRPSPAAVVLGIPTGNLAMRRPRLIG